MEINDIRHSEYAEMLLQNKIMLQRLCVRMARGDAELAKDYMQEVMMSLWTCFDKITASDSTAQKIKLYWFSRGLISNYIRTNQCRVVTADMDNTCSSEESHGRETLEDVALMLCDNDRNLLGMILDGYDTKEIADKLGVSVNVVYKRRANLIVKMRQVLLDS